MFFLKSLDCFWGKNPAFFLGITLLHAVYLALIFNVWVVFSFLVFTLSAYRRVFQIVVLGLCTYFYTLILYPGQTIETEEGIASLTVHEVQKIPTHYGHKKRALVTINHFKSEDHSVQKIPAYFYYKGLPKITSNQLLAQGSLIQWGPHSYLFRAKKVSEMPSTSSWWMTRGKIKKKLSSYLHRHMKHRQSAQFVYSLISGEVNNIKFRMLFTRLGLGHLLAISGFHFSIVMGLVALIFSKFSRKWSVVFLIIAATTYFMFVGGFASIKRAYLMLMVLFVGHFFSFKSSPINTLGVCLTILLLFDPIIALNLGFKLSFLATFSILLFYKNVENGLTSILPKRSLFEAKALSRGAQIGYVVTSLFRKGVAVNLAVYILSLPLILFEFGTFPLLGLYYNLFIPLVIGAILALSVVALLVPPLFPLLNSFTRFVLTSLEFFPRNMDYTMKIEAFPQPLLALLLAGGTLVGIFFYTKRGEEEGLLLN